MSVYKVDIKDFLGTKYYNATCSLDGISGWSVGDIHEFTVNITDPFGKPVTNKQFKIDSSGRNNLRIKDSGSEFTGGIINFTTNDSGKCTFEIELLDYGLSTIGIIEYVSNDLIKNFYIFSEEPSRWKRIGEPVNNVTLYKNRNQGKLIFNPYTTSTEQPVNTERELSNQLRDRIISEKIWPITTVTSVLNESYDVRVYHQDIGDFTTGTITLISLLNIQANSKHYGEFTWTYKI